MPTLRLDGTLVRHWLKTGGQCPPYGWMELVRWALPTQFDGVLESGFVCVGAVREAYPKDVFQSPGSVKVASLETF
jgi:hypothetical protein